MVTPAGAPAAAPAPAPAAPAPAPVPATPAIPALRPGVSHVEVYSYRRDDLGRGFEYVIHVVRHAGGGYEAIPVSPSQRWADASMRRSGPSAYAAIDVLVSEVLARRLPREVFPELAGHI
jgi:hypothetical protein